MTPKSVSKAEVCPDVYLASKYVSRARYERAKPKHVFRTPSMACFRFASGWDSGMTWARAFSLFDAPSHDTSSPYERHKVSFSFGVIRRC